MPTPKAYAYMQSPIDKHPATKESGSQDYSSYIPCSLTNKAACKQSKHEVNMKIKMMIK